MREMARVDDEPHDHAPEDDALYTRLVAADAENVDDLVQAAFDARLVRGQPAAEAATAVVAQVLLPAIRAARERYLAGGVILPALLRTAEQVHGALKLLGSPPAASLGTIVVATVEG